MSENTAKVLKAEATEAVTVVQFRGLELEIPKSMEDWPLEVMEAFEREQFAVLLADLLGPNQWKAVKGLRLKVKDLGNLLEEVLSQAGLTSGNSES